MDMRGDVHRGSPSPGIWEGRRYIGGGWE